MSKSRKSRGGSRRTNRRGGAAPLSYNLANDWSSRMSLGQGTDYMKYHVGQHGGRRSRRQRRGGAVSYGAPLTAIEQSMLDPSLRSHALVSGLDNALAETRGMQDGGRRRKKSRRCKKAGRRSKKAGRHCKSKRRHHRRRGGALGYATFPGQGMLLSSGQYAQAGLNPEWKSAVEFDDAMLRQAM